MRKLVVLLTSLGVSFAHLKPYPHEHVGFLHPEDIVLTLLVVALIGGVSFGLYKLFRARKEET